MTAKGLQLETMDVFSSDLNDDRIIKTIDKMSDDQIQRCLRYLETGVLIDEDGRTLSTATRH